MNGRARPLACFALCLLLSLPGCTRRQEKTSMHDDPRVTAFVSRIHFDRLTPAESDRVGVATAWPDPATLPPFADAGWKSRVTNVIETPGLVRRIWGVRRGEDSFRVTAIVSSSGSALAREQFLHVASNTMLSEIPYREWKDGPGEIAVEANGPKGQHLLWLHHNVCVQVDVFRGDVDGAALAKALQERLEAGASEAWQSRLPQLAPGAPGRPSYRVGETLRFAYQGRAAEAGGPLAVHAFETPPGRCLSWLDSGEQSAGFEAVEPGETTVDVAFVDDATLLSAWIRFVARVEAR